MINRTKIKGSMYDILDKDPSDIQEYIDAEAKKTPKQKEKETKKRNQKSNIVNVNLQNNIDNQEDNPYNRIVIHTEKDNLVHNYFHDFEMFWDAGDPLSGAILKLPKTNEDNTRYWITYTGDITIYLGNEINSEMHKSQDSQNEATYLDLQGMKPIFKGEIGRIKEYNKELEIHIDSIGKRFKQKIPEDFRQQYINNQNVRDAFQAICEFLGIKYICPPAQVTDEVETDGTENSVEFTVQQGVKQATNAVQLAKDQERINKTKNTAQNLLDKSTSGVTLQGVQLTGTHPTRQSGDNNDTNQNTNTELNANNQADIQNGYADISFDANGNIVHGSVGIETSPDMEDTLLSLESHPLDKYLKDTTFVATDVKRFLNGEMFETVHNSVMNYGAITLQPKSAATTEMSTVNTSTTGNTNNEKSQDNSQSSNAKHTSLTALNGKTGVTLGGVSLKGAKQSLSYDQVNALTSKQARVEMVKTNQYYYTTILRLRARARGYKVSASTNYSKFANG